MQWYPRVHRDCQLEMVDGEYATIIGMLKRNDTAQRRYMSVMNLEFEVDPAELAKLRGVSSPSGESLPL